MGSPRYTKSGGGGGGNSLQVHYEKWGGGGGGGGQFASGPLRKGSGAKPQRLRKPGPAPHKRTLTLLGGGGGGGFVRTPPGYGLATNAATCATHPGVGMPSLYAPPPPQPSMHASLTSSTFQNMGAMGNVSSSIGLGTIPPSNAGYCLLMVVWKPYHLMLA